MPLRNGNYFSLFSVIFATQLIVAIPVNAAVLVDENFDDGSYSDTGWTTWLQNTNCATGTTVAVNSGAAYRGANGLDIHYIIGDNPRGDCQLHQDNNTSLVHTVSPSLNHYFVRGYFKFPFSSSVLCGSPTVQRKLLYMKPTGWGGGSWAFFVNAWPWPDCISGGYNVSVGYGNAGGTGVTLWGNDPAAGFATSDNHVYVGRWYYIEIEVEYRTYGADILRIWLGQAGVSPKLILERSNLTLRSSSDASGGVGLGSVEIGRQVDVMRSSYSEGVNEHRYWDDFAIGTTRIGTSDGGVLEPYPPQSVR